MKWVRSSACEQARFLGALAPDETLSETEERLLARHLRDCVRCRTFAASVVAFTTELRTTPLVEPGGELQEGSGTARIWGRHLNRLPRARRPMSLRLPLVAAASALVSIVGTSMVVNSESAEPVVATPPGVLIVDAFPEDDSSMLRGLRDISYLRQQESDTTISKKPGAIAI